jgi:large subunit ribosomal protein L13
MKTYSAKPSDVSREWYVIDAAEAPLGRVATRVATLLIGKGKPQFTKHIDTGDFVIVINAKNLQVTGGKEDKKIYYRHSNYPGAIRGMLPVNKLRDARLLRLKIYADSEHKHEAQQPQVISIKDVK